MTLTIDSGTPIRTPARYRELAQAILDAPTSTQETDYVEWKSDVDLAEKRWQAQFGRHIIGFANREPDAAAGWFGGCAYLAAGVSPGLLPGTSVYDTATIEAWLQAYVGRAPEAPAWAPTYVDLHGKQVLIITIEAPAPGDPMWVCQREYSETRDGRERVITRTVIYVRRKGSTHEAGPADIAMLSRRLTARGRRVSGLSLLILPNSTAQAVDFGEDKLNWWVETERRATEPPPRPPVARTDEELAAPAPAESTGATIGADLLRAVTRLSEAANVGATFLYEPDGRTREQYMAEVETYLTKARKRLIPVLLRRCYERHLGRIRLAIRNETDDPMQDVRVELSIPARAARAMYEDDFPEAKLPSRPVMLGKLVRDRFSALSNAAVLPYVNLPRYDLASVPVARRIEIKNTGSAHITFDVGDLYPRETSALEEFFLFANYALDGDRMSALTAEWSVVARNLSGVQRGVIEIPVAPDPPNIDDLLVAEPPDDDSEDLDDDLDDLDD